MILHLSANVDIARLHRENTFTIKCNILAISEKTLMCSVWLQRGCSYLPPLPYVFDNRAHKKF